MTAWNIRSRSPKCSACNRPFAPGDKGHSLLEADPERQGEWRRRDLCPACFGALAPAFVRTLPGLWSFTVPKSAPRKGPDEAVRKESAAHLLRVLLAGNAPGDRAVIYVLAILLERGRKLIERSVAEGPEGRVHFYEARATGELLAIPEPPIAEADLPAIQARVLALLGGEDAR